MSKSFKKTCDRGCNTEIEMSNKEGAWRPFNLDGSPHECQAKLRPEPKASEEKQTEISKQNEEKIKNGNKETLQGFPIAEKKEYVDEQKIKSNGNGEKRLSDWVPKPTFSDSPQWTSYLLAYIADELHDMNKTLKLIMTRS
jgi:hypothetical protein